MKAEEEAVSIPLLDGGTATDGNETVLMTPERGSGVSEEYAIWR